MALRSIAGQAAVVVGPVARRPALRGRPRARLRDRGSPAARRARCVLALGPPPLTRRAPESRPGSRSLLAGISFIRRTPMILGAISLDLFAVLFGGAVALLPVFARSILHTGPDGLGVLRSAPAVGALLAGIIIVAPAARSPRGADAARRGRAVRLQHGRLRAVALVLLSLVALAVSGFADMISMNIRSTTVALATPDRAARARQLGRGRLHQRRRTSSARSSPAWRRPCSAPPRPSSSAAPLTIGIAAVWPRFFPALARVDRLEDVQPEWEPA